MGARWSGDAAAPSTETEQPNDAAKYKEPIAQTKSDGLQKPNVFSKDSLEFSFGSGIDGGEGNDEIVITNHKAIKVKYKIEAAPSTQCVITANPATGSIAPGKDKKIKLKADVKEKVNLNFKLTVHVGTEAHFLNVRVRSVTGVFGTDPSTLELVEDEDLMVPEVLVLMKKSLLMNDGLRSEGIFRLAGDVFEIAALKDQMNKKTFEKSDNVNTIATLIKVWFRELPEPILNKVPTEAIYYSSDQDKCVDAYRDLPEPSKTLLTWLLDLLCMTTAHSSVNRMTPQNLAIVVAPNLYDSASSDPMEGLVLSQKCVQFLNNVLLWYLEKKTGSVPEHVPSPAIPIQRSRDDSSAPAPSSTSKSPKRKITRNQTEFSPGTSGEATSGRKSPASPRNAVKRQKSTAPAREASSVSVHTSAPTSPTSPRAHASTVSEGVSSKAPEADSAVPVGITRPPPPMTPPPARWGSAGSINITPLSISNPEIKRSDDAPGKASSTPGSSPRGNSPRHLGTASSPSYGSNTLENGGSSSPDLPRRQLSNPLVPSGTPPAQTKVLSSLPPPGSPSPTRVASSGSVSSGSSSPRPARVMSPRSGRPSESIPRTSSFSITAAPPPPLVLSSTSPTQNDTETTPGSSTPVTAGRDGSPSSRPSFPPPQIPSLGSESPRVHTPTVVGSESLHLQPTHIPESPKPAFLRNMPPPLPSTPPPAFSVDAKKREEDNDHAEDRYNDEASPRLVDLDEEDPEDEFEETELPGGIPITVPFSSLPIVSASPPTHATPTSTVQELDS